MCLDPALSCVRPRNKIGPNARRHSRLMPVPAEHKIGSKRCENVYYNSETSVYYNSEILDIIM